MHVHLRKKNIEIYLEFETETKWLSLMYSQLKGIGELSESRSLNLHREYWLYLACIVYSICKQRQQILPKGKDPIGLI